MWSREMTLDQVMHELSRILEDRSYRPERFVIVEVGTLNHYVQFYLDEEEIYGEAVGSYYLTFDGRPGLTAEQHATLLWLGWDGPADPSPKEDGGDGHGNYYRCWPLDAPTDDVVMDLVRTLVSVFMTDEGGRIELHRSWEEPGDRVRRKSA